MEERKLDVSQRKVILVVVLKLKLTNVFYGISRLELHYWRSPISLR